MGGHTPLQILPHKKSPQPNYPPCKYTSDYCWLFNLQVIKNNVPIIICTNAESSTYFNINCRSLI